MTLLLEYVWHHFRCLAKRLATQHCAKIAWRCAHQNQSNKNPQPTLHSLIIGWLCSRAAQNFWSLMLQTPNWKLVQTVKLCQVSSPSEVFLPRPQRPEDIWPTYKDGLWWSFSGLYGRGKTTSDWLETWHTFMFWANFQFGVWGMRPQKFWAALLPMWLHLFSLIV